MRLVSSHRVLSYTQSAAFVGGRERKSRKRGTMPIAAEEEKGTKGLAWKKREARVRFHFRDVSLNSSKKR